MDRSVVRDRRAACIRARASLRISFGGGGTDIAAYYEKHGGAVLSATVNRYATATINVRPSESAVVVKSVDYDASVSLPLDQEISYDGQLGLAKAVIAHFRRTATFDQGVEVLLHNDAPPGSGLGSSSAISVAMIAAMSEFLRLPFDSYEVAELAYQIERVDAGIAGGKQDQYACTFGGFNFIELHQDGTTVVNPLRIRPDLLAELEYRLTFAFVGGSRFSGAILQKTIENVQPGGNALEAAHRIKSLAYEMKRTLLLGRFREFGELLHESWLSKIRLAEGIAPPNVLSLYEDARNAGAVGGKMTGAGGSGLMFFVCDPERRFSVQDAIQKAGGHIVPLSFVDVGVRSWRVQ